MIELRLSIQEGLTVSRNGNQAIFHLGRSRSAGAAAENTIVIDIVCIALVIRVLWDFRLAARWLASRVCNIHYNMASRP